MIHKNERKRAILGHNDAEISGTEELIVLLAHQKQESDKRVAALEHARSHVAFMGRPRKRSAHPRHILFADCYDDWTPAKIEHELNHEQEKNDALALDLAKAKALRRQHQTINLCDIQQSEDFSHSADYRSVKLGEASSV